MTHPLDDPPHGNPGTYISGNTFNGPMASGYQAQAVQHTHGIADADLATLETLLRQLEADVRQLGGAPAAGALADIGRMRSEVTQRDPDRPRIYQLLGRVTGAVSPLASLLEVADRIKDLMPLIVH